jgi:hypothetical protein
MIMVIMILECLWLQAVKQLGFLVYDHVHMNLAQ